MASTSEEHLYRRITALERANLLWKAATLILALAVIALLVLGGSVGLSMALNRGSHWEEMLAAEQRARAEAERARQAEAQARQAEAQARQQAEAARQRAEEALRAAELRPPEEKKAP